MEISLKPLSRFRGPLLSSSSNFVSLPSTVLATGLYAAALVAGHLAGFRMRVPWGYYQLLDAEWLLSAPGLSLLYMHSQPPGLNVLLWAVLTTSELTGHAPEIVAKSVFVVVGWAAVLLTYWLVRAQSGPVSWAVVAVLALLANPAFQFFGNLFFYPFLVHTLLLLVVWTAWRYLDAGSWRLYPLVLTLAAVCLTRVLYHPLWAIAVLTFAVAARTWVVGSDCGGARLAWRQAVVPAVLLLGLLTAWPLKNYLLFGHFINTSWTGFNLANTLPIDANPEFTSFVRSDTVSPEMNQRLEDLAWQYPEAIRSNLLSPRKSDGSKNYNHLVVLLTNDDLRARAIQWRLRNPATWASKFIGQYWSWTRATFVDPYSGEIRGPDKAAYRSYAELVRKFFFFDLRPMVERTVPLPIIHEFSFVRRAKLPYTFFGVVLFPAIMVGSLVFLIHGIRRKKPLDMALFIGWATVLWSMAVPNATFGSEGNRMRFATVALCLVLIVYTFHGIRSRFKQSTE